MKHIKYSCDLCGMAFEDKLVSGFQFSSMLEAPDKGNIAFTEELEKAHFHICAQCLSGLDKCVAANQQKIFGKGN